VRISKIALAHGNLSVKVKGKSEKETVEEKISSLEGVSVGELVQSLNKLGVSPKDLMTLLQSIKAAGALHGELEIL
ncbi:MAG: flagellar basal body P-ring protein FlgI, partial [Bdellovibrio sp.]